MTDNNTQSGAEPEEQYVTNNDLKIAMDELWSEKNKDSLNKSPNLLKVKLKHRSQGIKQRRK